MKKPRQDQVKFLDDSDGFRRSVISKVGFCLGAIVLLAAGPRNLISPGNPITMIRAILLGVALLTIPILIRRNFKTQFCGILLIFLVSSIAVNGGFTNAGMAAPVTVLFVLTPILGFFCLGNIGSRAALLFSFTGIAILLAAEKYSYTEPLNSPDKYTLYKSFIYACAIVSSYAIGAVYEHSRKKAELHLNELNTKAAHSFKMASLGEMSAGIAHEINNPLAIIAGKANLLSKHSQDPAKLLADIDSIQMACMRISKIVYGLKKFSRSSEITDFSYISLSTIANEAVTLTEAKTKSSNIFVTLETNTEAKIFCNEVEIEQVLINLIQNAADAVSTCQEKWIRIALNEDSRFVSLQIMDSGSGISKEVQDKIFVPFFTTKATGQGTGLGLSISKGILDEHNATIELLPQSSNTCFEIKFPKVESKKTAA